jgi:hypothetical protein
VKGSALEVVGEIHKGAVLGNQIFEAIIPTIHACEMDSGGAIGVLAIDEGRAIGEKTEEKSEIAGFGGRKKGGGEVGHSLNAPER